MRLPARLSGHGLVLRPVRPDDAALVHRLRGDAGLARHLSPVTGGVAGQRAWIERALTRHDQAYYAIEAAGPGTARPCGLVRLSQVTPERFTWGSWILDPATKPRRAALASALLVYRAGFAVSAEAVFDVRRGNARTLAFHDRFGARRVGETGTDILYRLSRADWTRLVPRLEAALQEVSA